MFPTSMQDRSIPTVFLYEPLFFWIAPHRATKPGEKKPESDGWSVQSQSSVHRARYIYCMVISALLSRRRSLLCSSVRRFLLSAKAMPPPPILSQSAAEAAASAVEGRGNAPRKDSEAEDWVVDSFVGASNFNTNQIMHKRELAHRLERERGKSVEKGGKCNPTFLHVIFIEMSDHGGMIYGLATHRQPWISLLLVYLV